MRFRDCDWLISKAAGHQRTLVQGPLWLFFLLLSFSLKLAHQYFRFFSYPVMYRPPWLIDSTSEFEYRLLSKFGKPSSVKQIYLGYMWIYLQIWRQDFRSTIWCLQLSQSWEPNHFLNKVSKSPLSARYPERYWCQGNTLTPQSCLLARVCRVCLHFDVLISFIIKCLLCKYVLSLWW